MPFLVYYTFLEVGEVKPHVGDSYWFIYTKSCRRAHITLLTVNGKTKQPILLRFRCNILVN